MFVSVVNAKSFINANSSLDEMIAEYAKRYNATSENARDAIINALAVVAKSKMLSALRTLDIAESELNGFARKYSKAAAELTDEQFDSACDGSYVCDVENTKHGGVVLHYVIACGNDKWEFDVCAEHVHRIALGGAIERGRRVITKSVNEEARAIREWGISEGMIEPGMRGRLSQAVIDAYHEAHKEA